MNDLQMTKEESAAWDAISRALDEAGIKQEVLRAMCLEVGMDTFRDAMAKTP